MDQNKLSGKNIGDNLQKTFKKILSIIARWFFMFSLLAAAAFCVFIWNRYIRNAAWDESKKQQYISEQAKFSFDKKGYQNIVDLIENRKQKLENFPKFAGRDLFSPEGF